MSRPMRMKIGVVFFSLLLGCGGAAKYVGGSSYDAAMAPPPSPQRAFEPTAAPGGDASFAGDSMNGALASMVPVAAPTSTGGASGGPAQTAVDPTRAPLLIYTASMNLAVFQVVEASKMVETMAREAGGFLARRDDTSIVIRIPAGKFDDILKRIEKLGDVLHRNVTAEDVTEQYMDVEVRLKNARAVRDRLQQLLEKAAKVEESLAIEKELTRVGTEIETLEGKLKYLRDRIMFSTITVSFQPKQSDTVKPSVRIPVDWLNELGLGRLLNL